MIYRALIAAVLVIGCGSPAPMPSSSTPSSGHYSDGTMSFDYPPAWRAATFQYFSTMSELIVYLSPQPLSEPCTRSPNSIACGQPVQGLEPNSVLVSWWYWGSLGADPATFPGDPVNVDGRSGRLTNAPDSGSCTSIGGDSALKLTTTAPATPAGNWIEMDACWRGPNGDATRAQILALISSVKWLAAQ